jgi:hypothetical protein
MRAVASNGLNIPAVPDSLTRFSLKPLWPHLGHLASLLMALSTCKPEQSLFRFFVCEQLDSSTVRAHVNVHGDHGFPELSPLAEQQFPATARAAYPKLCPLSKLHDSTTRATPHFISTHDSTPPTPPAMIFSNVLKPASASYNS